MQRTFRPALAVAAVVLALVLAFAALPFFGKNPLDAFEAMLRGGVGSPTAIG